MLFYTSKNSKRQIEATYNGRFAFIYFNNIDEYERIAKLRNGNGLSNLWELTSCDDSAKRVLRHENTHKQIFARSKTGLMLNSLRLMTQLRFLLFGSHQGIESYYKMRTAYLMETISYHEQIAASIDAQISRTTQSVESIIQHELEINQSTIEEAEQRIQKKWKSENLEPEKIMGKVHLALGKILHEHFAIHASTHNEQGRWIPKAFADSGVVNDLHEYRKDNTQHEVLMKKFLYHCFIIRIAKMERFTKSFEWYWIGQRTQFEYLKEKYDISLKQFSEEILTDSVPFIMRWAGVPTNLLSSLLQLAVDTLEQDKDVFRRSWQPTLDKWEDDRNLNLYFSFFMQPGN